MHPQSLRPIRLLIQLGIACILSGVSAGDWPQWRGPNRDGHSNESGLLKQWPEAGPDLLWRIHDIGQGYGSPSVVGDRVYIIVNEGIESEIIKALDVEDGTEKWSVPLGKVGNPDQRPNYPGARSTPTIAGEEIFALGSDGDLVCLDAGNGKIRWKRSLRTDFSGKPGEWAYSESPLVDEDRVVVAPGGPDMAVVALDKRNGSKIWSAAVPGNEAAGYASVVISNAGNQRQYVSLLGSGLVGIDATNGKLMWTYNKTSGRANIPTPLTSGPYVYSGASRVGGATIEIKVGSSSVVTEEKYFSPKLPNAIGGFVLVDGYLYGCGGQTMMCVDFETGAVKWEERVNSPGALCYADGLLYMSCEDGEVRLLSASPDGYFEKGRFTPSDRPQHENGMQKAWAYPVLADGRLYIRDLGTIWCFDVKG